MRYYTEADVQRAREQAAEAGRQVDIARRLTAAMPHADEYERQMRRCVVGAFFALAAVAGAALFVLFGVLGPAVLAAYGLFVAVWSGEQARRARAKFIAARPGA